MITMKKLLWIGCMVFLLSVGVHTALAGTLLEIRSSLSGEVTWTVPVGTTVAEGNELIRISTLTGEAVAARAPGNGTVKEVMIKNGDRISAGNLVVRIEK